MPFAPTRYASIALANKLSGHGGVTPPSTYYIALGDYAGAGWDYTGSGGTEIDPAWNYARVPFSANPASVTSPYASIVDGGGTFNPATVTVWIAPELDWPEILTHVWSSASIFSAKDPQFYSIWDSPTGGNCWFYGEFVSTPVAGSIAPIGMEYFSAPSSFMYQEAGGVWTGTMKAKMIDWLLRGVDFTVPAWRMGWIRRKVTTPYSPNLFEETFEEVSTSGTGYARHAVSWQAWEQQTVGSSFVTNVVCPLNGTHTWNVTGSWGFDSMAALFDGASGGLVAMGGTHFYNGFPSGWIPLAGDTIIVGPATISPTYGGCGLVFGLHGA